MYHSLHSTHSLSSYAPIVLRSTSPIVLRSNPPSVLRVSSIVLRTTAPMVLAPALTKDAGTREEHFVGGVKSAPQIEVGMREEAALSSAHEEMQRRVPEELIRTFSKLSATAYAMLWY